MQPYQADHTGKITIAGHPECDANATHELLPNQRTLCDRPAIHQQNLRGMTVTTRDDGPGTVDCWHCRRRRYA
jgi:hypothetical protein